MKPPIPVEVQRWALNKSSPIPEEKLAIWKNISIPSARIFKEEGGYKPVPIMWHAHRHPARIIMPVGGIRGSKSVGGAMEAVTWSPHSDLIWLAGDAYETSRQEFEYIMEAMLSLNWTAPNLISFPQNAYNQCTLETKWGTMIQTRSLADPKSFASRAPDFILMCEPGQTSETSVFRAIERTSTWRAKLWLPGTLEDSAPWMDLRWKKWARWDWEDNAKSYTVPTYGNRAIFPEGNKDPEYLALKRSADMEGPEMWLRRLVGVPGARHDIIFGDTFKLRHHVTEAEYLRKDHGDFVPVYAAIDPGYSGNSKYVLLAIQIVGHEIRVIDEVAEQHRTHESIKDLAMRREWWPVMNNGTIDPYAGDSHALGSVSPKDVWARDDHGGSVELFLPKRLAVDDLIRLIKSYLTGESGYTLKVSPRCLRLIEEFQQWRRVATPDGLGRPADAYCDAIKALGYFLVGHQTGTLSTSTPTIRVMRYSLAGGGAVDPVALAAETAQDYGRYF